MSRRLGRNTIENIKSLRSRGYSIPEISKEMKVSKTTVLRHIREVTILPEFIAGWIGKRGGSKKRRLLKEEQTYYEAKSLVSLLSLKEKLLFISALYWGEGNKSDLTLINSDPKLIKTYLTGMRDIFNLPDDSIRVNIRVHSNLNYEECLRFWSDITNISESSFGRTEVIQAKENGKLSFGMCRVRILKGGDILKKIKSINRVIYELVSERGNIGVTVPVAQ